MIIVLIGPTASGKSSLAIKLAQYYHAEIINGDAFQIYKGMDIGTAKPSKEEFELVNHHLFSFVEPNVNYSVKDYQTDCRREIDTLQKEKKNIIIVGGTGLYIRAALYDYDFPINEQIDMSKYILLNNEDLHKELQKLDPEEAQKLHCNNRKRVLRSIEICLSNNMKKSDMIAKQSHELIYDNVKFFAPDISRDILYERINNRVDEMFKNGFVNEVKQLITQYDKTSRAFLAIGYKEIIMYLDGEISLDNCIEEVKKHTRNYAKRQITFIKHQFPTIFINDIEDIKNEYL